MNIIKLLRNSLFSEDYEIQHKLLNLTLIATFAGGVLCLITSLILQLNVIASVIIGIVVLLVSFGIYLSIVKKKTKLATVLTSIVSIAVFPVMYFFSGGMKSGMPVWFVVSLIISWLIHKGKACGIVYIINTMVLTSCILLEVKFPHVITPISSDATIASDIIQCMIVVSCVLGIIFKYQSYIYEKQRSSLEQQKIELRETMLALERANQAKNEFLTNMSHEIRTPINAIIGMDEIILRENDNNEIAHYAESIKEASNNLLGFVNDILDFSKIESGSMEIEEYSYKFDEMVNSVNKLIRPKIDKKGLEYRIEIDDNIPNNLIGDNFKINRIINNLLSNAVKFTNDGYVALAISCEVHDDIAEFKISVADTGIGIAQENINYVFDRFSRLELNKNRNIEGAGLGLTITKRLVELMGGDISVKSVYGSGSIFIVNIPQKIDVNSVDKKIEKNIVVKPFVAPNARILAVDDNTINLEVVQCLLKKYGISADVASGGDECLKLCGINKYDIIFMDHMMPSPDGVETLKILRKDSSTLNSNTPVVVLTANVIKGVRERYLEDGFTDYLGKPIDIKELERVLFGILPEYLVEIVENNETSEEVKHEKVSYKKEKSCIDRKVGLEYFSGDESMYNDILETYYEQSMRYKENLPVYFSNQDWKNYTIAVHALKSTSLNIGATELSKLAKEQEVFGKGNDGEKISQTFDKFMNNLDKVLKEIETMLSINPN